MISVYLLLDCPPPCGRQACGNDVRNGPFYRVKWAETRHETAHSTRRKGLFRNALSASALCGTPRSVPQHGVVAAQNHGGPLPLRPRRMQQERQMSAKCAENARYVCICQLNVVFLHVDSRICVSECSRHMRCLPTQQAHSGRGTAREQHQHERLGIPHEQYNNQKPHNTINRNPDYGKHQDLSFGCDERVRAPRRINHIRSLLRR